MVKEKLSNPGERNTIFSYILIKVITGLHIKQIHVLKLGEIRIKYFTFIDLICIWLDSAPIPAQLGPNLKITGLGKAISSFLELKDCVSQHLHEIVKMVTTIWRCLCFQLWHSVSALSWNCARAWNLKLRLVSHRALNAAMFTVLNTLPLKAKGKMPHVLCPI